MHLTNFITLVTYTSAILGVSARSIPFTTPLVFDPARFGFNVTEHNELQRRWGAQAQGKAPELKMPGSGYGDGQWVNCPEHKEWPHQEHVFHPPGLNVDIPWNKPTDHLGNPIQVGAALDRYGRRLPGPLKDPEIDPGDCCRPTWRCYEMVWKENAQRRSWIEMRKQDPKAFAVLQCCIREYTLTCPDPQRGPDWHWNAPPLCSNGPF